MSRSRDVVARIAPIAERLEGASWLPILLMRLFIGYFFLETGWGKIHNLDAMTMRFTQWGIPWPAFNAALSGYTELLGGACILVGFATRLVALPMAFNMLVAIVAVKMHDVASLNDFVEMDEPLYGLVFVWLFFTGAGAVSVDRVLAHLFGAAARRSP